MRRSRITQIMALLLAFALMANLVPAPALAEALDEAREVAEQVGGGDS